jgi:hypothetical protein
LRLAIRNGGNGQQHHLALNEFLTATQLHLGMVEVKGKERGKGEA